MMKFTTGVLLFDADKQQFVVCFWFSDGWELIKITIHSSTNTISNTRNCCSPARNSIFQMMNFMVSLLLFDADKLQFAVCFLFSDGWDLMKIAPLQRRKSDCVSLLY